MIFSHKRVVGHSETGPKQRSNTGLISLPFRKIWVRKAVSYRRSLFAIIGVYPARCGVATRWVTPPASKNGLLISSALADDQSDIVVLFVRTELSDLLDYCRYHCLWRQLSVRFQRFDQTLFAEFFTHIVE